MSDNNQNIRWELLIKEMDIIEDTVKNIDGAIYKIKNFAFAAWGGGLYLIAQHLDGLKNQHYWLYFGTIIIPILFWVMDAQWQKHLLICIERKKNIAQFVNGSDFKSLILEEKELPKNQGFPFYDPIGCYYTIKKGKKSLLAGEFPTKYLADKRESNWFKAIFYKGSWLFYSMMILLSTVISIFSCRYILSETISMM